MRALVTGAGGQLGRALLSAVPAGTDIAGLRSRQLDITDAAAVHAAISDFRPDIVLNAAAYTAVDRAETDEDAARAINHAGVANLVAATDAIGARLVHVSTDFVFGEGHSRPIPVDAACAPASIYASSKRDGELAALAGANALTVRTSWVYASAGSNFVLTMLRLMAERERIGVVADQIGTPTWASDLARALWVLAATDEKGVLHYRNSGVASWYDFAVAIQEEALDRGLLQRQIPVEPISTAEYPTPAVRPSYSVLDISRTNHLLGTAPPHWRTSLRMMLAEVNQSPDP